jgi:hypothetical protein
MEVMVLTSIPPRTASRYACTLAVLAGCGAPLAFAGLLYAGLQHSPAGSASLSLGPGNQLLVSNIGPSGLDGVAINCTQSEFWVGQFKDPGSLPLPNGLRWVAVGQTSLGSHVLVDAGLDGEIGLYDLDVIFPYLGGGALKLVQVFMGETLISQITTTLPQVAQFNPTDFTIKLNSAWPDASRIAIEMAFPVAIPITPAGQPTVPGTRVVVSAASIGNVLAVQNVPVTAYNVSSFVILGEQIGKFNLPQRAKGQASLIATGACPSCTLQLGNLGPSGNDGLEIELPDADDFIVQWAPLAPNGGLPTGNRLRASASGRYTSGPSGPVGSLSIVDVGAELHVEADYAPLGSLLKRVEAYSNGQLVFADFVTTPVVATLLSDAAWPSAVETHTHTGPQSLFSFIPTGDQHVLMTILGTPVAVNELRVLAEMPAPGTTPLDTLVLEIDPPIDIPGPHVTGQELDCPADIEGDLDGDGEVGLSDLGEVLADFGCQSPPACSGDVDGDGDTDLGDLGVVLSSFGFTCP